MRIEQLYLVAALTGALTVIFDVAYQSALPGLVQREHLLEGNSKLGLSDHDILEREFAVYDALYLECKERASDRSKPARAPSLFEIASIVR